MIHLQQRIVRGKSLDNVNDWASDIWVGTIGGSVLPTDPDPNVSPPSPGRIIKVSPRRGSCTFNGTQSTRLYLILAPLATESLTVQFWFKTAGGLWLTFSTTVTIAYPGSGQVAASINNTFGAKWFIQVLANTNVQAFLMTLA